MSTQAERDFLLEQFRGFYAQVLRFKAQIEAPKTNAGGASAEEERLDDLLVEEPEDQPTTPAEGAQQQAKRIQDELLALCQQQSQAILRRGDEREARRFREIQYVMAALADEVMLNLNWEGREYWSANLLEHELFHTHDAGTRFFVNLEEILKQRDPTRADVAAAYLLALSLGFHGRYRDVQDQPRLENFRHQLFALLFQRNPGLAEDAQLYPQSYAHTLSGKKVEWLPVLRPWLFGLLGVVLGYVVLSHAIWAQGISEVGSSAERVGRQLRASKARQGDRPKPERPPAAPQGAPAIKTTAQAPVVDEPAVRPVSLEEPENESIGAPAVLAAPQVSAPEPEPAASIQPARMKINKKLKTSRHRSRRHR